LQSGAGAVLSAGFRRSGSGGYLSSLRGLRAGLLEAAAQPYAEPWLALRSGYEEEAAAHRQEQRGAPLWLRLGPLERPQDHYPRRLRGLFRPDRLPDRLRGKRPERNQRLPPDRAGADDAERRQSSARERTRQHLSDAPQAGLDHAPLPHAVHHGPGPPA